MIHEEKPGRVLVTGATGFVGRSLVRGLQRAAIAFRCGSRRPEAARERDPSLEWVELDVDRGETLDAALAGIEVAYYLVHHMGQDGDYEAREKAAASRFASAAARAGVRRIIYLGGVRPTGAASKHLRSRRRTADVLIAGAVPTIELRAGMIVGSGSESWCICRDLAVRLPVMVLPSWLRSRSQPIGIDDVVAALVHALFIADEDVGSFAIPGPESLAAKEILMRVSGLRGTRPRTVNFPLVTPRLSSYWIQLVTRADRRVARELVEGLKTDLLAQGETFWKFLPDHKLMPFDEAARRALEADKDTLSLKAQIVERVAKELSVSLPS